MINNSACIRWFKKNWVSNWIIKYIFILYDQKMEISVLEFIPNFYVYRNMEHMILINNRNDSYTPFRDNYFRVQFFWFVKITQEKFLIY